MSEPLRCALHPEVETGLRCGRCGQPICPRCVVQTPVGGRCPTCARQTRLPTYQVSSTHYLLAAAVGLPLGVVTGFLWSFLPFLGYLSLIVPLAAGYLLAEVMSRAVNRKRSPGLAAIAGLSLALAYLVKTLLIGALLWAFFDILGLLALAGGIYIAVSRFR